MKIPDNVFFWQFKHDLQRYLLSLPRGNTILLVLNYLIWPFFVFVSFLLVFKSPNVFWQLFLATFIAEFFERYIKNKVYWPRPMTLRHDPVPCGLVPAWYNTGSFPSGHTTKAMYFFLFAIQYHVISPAVFVLYTLPLIIFRVLVGFHYPIDILGGIVIGLCAWAIASVIVFPAPLVEMVRVIFSIIPNI